MEKHKISEAINQHNWVVAINQQTAEYLLAKAEGEKRVAKFQSQKNRVIFSEEIKIKLVTACPGNLSLLRNSTLKKMEICYDVFYRYRTFFGFSLELWLLNNRNSFLFTIAKTEEGFSGYLVQSFKKERIIQDGGSSIVEFASEADFLKVITFCDDSIKEFNSFLGDKEKLVYHLEKFESR
jgi:hypothetical protein